MSTVDDTADSATDSSVPDVQLDARQRAMLEEMGLKVWWPAAVPGASGTPEAVQAEAAEATSDGAVLARQAGAQASPAERRAAPVVSAAPAPSATRPQPLAAPAAAIGTDVLVDTPRHLFGATNATGGWLVVADMPPDLHGHHGEPLAGDEGRLLANMLRALQLDRGPLPVHLMRTHRGERLIEEGAPMPVGEALVPQLASLAPRMVLAMGPLAAQVLLQRREPIGKLRGPALPLAGQEGTQLVATYHPAYLLRNGADKGRAWVDLCTAAAAFDAGRLP